LEQKSPEKVKVEIEVKAEEVNQADEQNSNGDLLNLNQKAVDKVLELKKHMDNLHKIKNIKKNIEEKRQKLERIHGKKLDMNHLMAEAAINPFLRAHHDVMYTRKLHNTKDIDKVA